MVIFIASLPLVRRTYSLRNLRREKAVTLAPTARRRTGYDCHLKAGVPVPWRIIARLRRPTHLVTAPLNVVVLAAGQGKRMRSALPKVLHPLAGRPVVSYVVDAARSLSPRAIAVVVGHGADAVRAALPGARPHFRRAGSAARHGRRRARRARHAADATARRWS